MTNPPTAPAEDKPSALVLLTRALVGWYPPDRRVLPLVEGLRAINRGLEIAVTTIPVAEPSELFDALSQDVQDAQVIQLHRKVAELERKLDIALAPLPETDDAWAGVGKIESEGRGRPGTSRSQLIRDGKAGKFLIRQDQQSGRWEIERRSYQHHQMRREKTMLEARITAGHDLTPAELARYDGIEAKLGL